MKPLILVFFLATNMLHCLAQQTHKVTVAINQSESCDQVLGLNENPSPVLIYPNPAKNKLMLKSSESVKQVALYGLSGNLLMSSPLRTIDKTIDISQIRNGIYLIQIKTNSATYVHKILINND